MKKLYVVSGVTGMTGNELVRQLLKDKSSDNYIIGFDNFYASSLADFLRLFDLYGKSEMLQEKQVKDLTRNDKAILAFTWLGYLDLFGR